MPAPIDYDALAYDALCAAFLAAWVAAGGEAGRIEWPNVAEQSGDPQLFGGDQPWARFTVEWVDGDQRTFGEVGGRVFDRAGTFVAQLFAAAGKRGLEVAGPLAKAVRDAYEGKTLDGVRLHRVARKDVGVDGPWYQVNVGGLFEYDEVR